MNRKSGLIILLLPLFLALAAFGAEAPAANGEGETGPVLTVKKNQRMLVVTMKGDPSKVGGKAMKSRGRLGPGRGLELRSGRGNPAHRSL